MSWKRTGSLIAVLWLATSTAVRATGLLEVSVAKAQAMLIGSVTAVIALMLLLIQFLDDPYRDGLGSLEPVAMERALEILSEEKRVSGETGAAPCDADGRRLTAAPG